MLVSGVQQSDSVIYMYFLDYLFSILGYYKPNIFVVITKDIEYSSLGYTVNLCLSILCIVICIC